MADLAKVIADARKVYNTGITRSISWRKKQLHALLQFLEENEESITGALKKDLRKNSFEVFASEINVIRTEIIDALQDIDKWTKPEYPKASGLAKLNKMYIRKEPYGLCMIIGAWNFPILLILQPLVGAIAAGNCAVIKPSEVSFHCAELLQNLLPKYLHKECFPVILTDGTGSANLLQTNRFDLIFYTGSENVGKLVMSAASKYLTPVILELGGKNPCIIDRNCDLKVAAKRIACMRFINAGQICIAPDHILCDEKVHDELVEYLKTAIHEFFGNNPKDSDSFGRIVNERHVERLKKLLPSGKIVIGGEVDEENKYIAPTVLVDVVEDSPIMKEEVFGPILPVLKVKHMDEAIASVNRREKPLGLYLFSKDQDVIDRVLDGTSSGGVTINDCGMHFNEFLPFGGIGNSGMGNYHGQYTFEAFSHKRSCFQTKLPEAMMKIRYPPHSDKKIEIIKRYVMKKLPNNGTFSFVVKLLKLSVIGILLAYLYQHWMIS